MALSKSISANGSKGHHKFTLQVVEDTTSGNYSYLSYTFKLSPIYTSYRWNGWGNKISYTVTINGNNYTGTIPAYDGYATVTLKSGSNIAVEHNSDGTKTINISFSVTDGANQSYTCGNASASGTFTLSTLHTAPRITSGGMTELNGQITALGVHPTIIVYNLSEKKISINAEFYDDATLSAFNVYNNDVLIGTSGTNEVTIDFKNIYPVADFLKWEVVDSLGGKGYATPTHHYIDYQKPTIDTSSTGIRRKTDYNTGLIDNIATLRLSGTYYAEDDDIGNNNTITKVEYKIWEHGTTEPSYTDITTQATISDGSVSITGGYDLSNIDFEKVYDYKIKLTDYFGSEVELSKPNGVPTGVAVWTEYKDHVDFLDLTKRNNKVLSSKVLYEDDNGTNGNFVLDFSATDYDFVQIVYGRDTWNDPMISNIFYKNANDEFYCALSVSYGYSSSNVVMSCAFLTISGTNATYDNNRSVRVDIENTITRSNVNAINVYKVIGYK